VCASPSDQVNFDEAPNAADLECWNLACRGQGAQRDWVQPQGRGGLGKSQKRSRHLFLGASVKSAYASTNPRSNIANLTDLNKPQ
jgi:hypothetical protein